MVTDTHTEPQLDRVREVLRGPLRRLVAGLRAGLRDNLQSVSIIGSSLTQDFQFRHSDINTVVLVADYNVPALNAVAVLAPTLRRHRITPPLLLTPFYLQRSRDVFGIEFLDFQLTHETILGPDPFTGLRFGKGPVRLQCERELKAMLLRLRQGYLAAAGDKRMIHDLLIAATKSLSPLLRALLWLVDADRPRTMDSTLRRTAGEFKVDLGAILAIQHWRYEKVRMTDAEMESTFVAVLDAVEHLATIIDGLEV